MFAYFTCTRLLTTRPSYRWHIAGTAGNNSPNCPFAGCADRFPSTTPRTLGHPGLVSFRTASKIISLTSVGGPTGGRIYAVLKQEMNFQPHSNRFGERDRSERTNPRAGEANLLLLLSLPDLRLFDCRAHVCLVCLVALKKRNTFYRTLPRPRGMIFLRKRAITFPQGLQTIGTTAPPKPPSKAAKWATIGFEEIFTFRAGLKFYARRSV